MSTTTIAIPGHLSYFVSSNRRMHWSRRHEIQQYWRSLSAVTCRHVPPFTTADYTFTVGLRDKRRRDIHNYTNLVFKPIIDGTVDAGVLADDSDRFLTGLTLRVDRDAQDFFIRLTISGSSDDE